MAFAGACGQGQSEVYLLNADGTGGVRLTTGSDSESSASWTADGQSLGVDSWTR